MLDFFVYYLMLLVGTLGVFFACGLIAYMISRMFVRLVGHGSGAVFDVTAAVGTPVHELGHAVMCKLFGHKLTRMQLWNPRPTNGVYGFVEHSYSRRNLWARLGNLFIGMGPLFSGLGVIVLVLWLCYPELWSGYLAYSSSVAIVGGEIPFHEVAEGVLMLFAGIPEAFRVDWLKSLLGLLIILPVSLHITLSPQDVKNSMNALPLYLFLLGILACATYWTPAAAPFLSILLVLNLRLLSLFALVIGFSMVWLAIAAVVRFLKLVVKWF